MCGLCVLNIDLLVYLLGVICYLCCMKVLYVGMGLLGWIACVFTEDILSVSPLLAQCIVFLLGLQCCEGIVRLLGAGRGGAVRCGSGGVLALLGLWFGGVMCGHGCSEGVLHVLEEVLYVQLNDVVHWEC